MSARDDLVSFSVKAAHDLNNTVAALTMALEMALDEVPEGEEDLASLLERVQRSAAKLAASIDDLPASAEAWPLSD